MRLRRLPAARSSGARSDGGERDAGQYRQGDTHVHSAPGRGVRSRTGGTPEADVVLDVLERRTNLV